MSYETTAGCFGSAFLISNAVAWIGSGAMAWDYIKPESIGGALLFLIAWAFFGYIGQLILDGFNYAFFGNK